MYQAEQKDGTLIINFKGRMDTNAGSEVEIAMKAEIEKAGLPTEIKGSTTDELIEYMQRDKKTRAGKLRFILLERIGRAFVSDAPPLKDIRAVLKKRIVSLE